MPIHSTLRDRRWLALLVLPLLLALLAACGQENDADEASDTPASDDSAFPVSVLSGPLKGGEEISIEQEPTRIVSLSPTATEMLWAIDAGDQVEAVDDQSDYPEGVPVTKLSAYEPNLEAILGYEPDLVITSGDTGDLVAGLEKVKVPTLVLPAATNLDEMYSQFERLGAATGHVAEAAKLVAEVKTGMEDAVANAPDVKGMTYFHELDPTLFTVTSKTFIGQVYGLFGLENIADPVKEGDGYPQLNDEFLVEADPDLVFLSDNECCGITPEKVADRPGWDRISAVRDGHVYMLDEDIASRWGPRVVEFAEMISEHLAARETANAG